MIISRLIQKFLQFPFLSYSVIAALHPWQVVCNTICAIKGRISIPAIFNQSIKAFLPCVVILYYFEIIPFTSVIISLLIFHVSITLIFLLYTSKLETIRPKISLSKFAKVFNLPAMAMFAGFSMFTSVGITLTNQIDVLMITTISGTYDTGLYSWALFCATAVAIPYSILASITTPIISKLWSSDNLFEINKLYKSSSATLLFISLLLFLGLWLVIDDLFIIMPKGIEYSASKPLVLLLCVSKIIDMGTGLNSHILSMSKNYKMLLWFLLGSAVINVGLNYILIPQFGLIGCGTATITSIVFFNLCKFIYIKTKFKIQPFTRNTIHLIACALACYALVFILPKTSNSLINLALYSSLFCGLFAFLTYRLNLSPDVNKFVEKAFNKLTK